MYWSGTFSWSGTYSLVWDIYLCLGHMHWPGPFWCPIKAGTFFLVWDILFDPGHISWSKKYSLVWVIYLGWDIFPGLGHVGVSSGQGYLFGLGYFPWSGTNIMVWDIFLGLGHISWLGTFFFFWDILLSLRSRDLYLGPGYFDMPSGLGHFSWSGIFQYSTRSAIFFLIWNATLLLDIFINDNNNTKQILKLLYLLCYKEAMCIRSLFGDHLYLNCKARQYISDQAYIPDLNLIVRQTQSHQSIYTGPI